MSILDLFSPEQFYERRASHPLGRGQLCWIPVPHIDPIPKILAVERDLPTEHETVKFHIREANQHRDFKTSERVLPLKYLKLPSTEELLIQRAKKRPGVILSTGMDMFPDVTRLLRRRGKKHLQEDAHFVIPCYSIQEEVYGSGFPREMLPRIHYLLLSEPSGNIFPPHPRQVRSHAKDPTLPALVEGRDDLYAKR